MKPIIFSTPMVQAILDGRKTQTRRVIKFCEGCTGRNPGRDVTNPNRALIFSPTKIHYSPYSVGDVLWVRETWKPQDYSFVDNVMSCQIIFKAGGPDNLNPRVFWNHGDDTIFESCGTWHPSIHMPRSAARLFLRVTDVGVERVQDIKAKDATAEGVGRLFEIDVALDEKFTDIPFNMEEGLAVHQFARLWDSINAKRGYGWDSNPWVWVYTFERITKEAENEQNKN